MPTYLVVSGLPHADVGGSALDGGVRHERCLASLRGLERGHVARSNGGLDEACGSSDGSHLNQWSAGGAEARIEEEE